MRSAIGLESANDFCRWVLLACLLCLPAVLLQLGCGDKQAQAFDRPPAQVMASPAIAQDVPTYIDAVGKTVAREVVSIQPQVSGRITEIHFADGAQLKTGDLLFTIDPRPYEAAVHEAEASLAQRKAQLDLANIAFARAQDLVQKEFIAKQEFDARRNDVDVAKAMVQQSEAALESARLNLDYCAIHSPIDGRAGHRLVDLGNVVKPENNAALLVIERMDPIYADFTITENDLTAVQQNMARSDLKAEVRLPDDSDHPREGGLSFLDNTVQDGTGTIKLRATIPNKDQRFWPGRLVNVRLVLNTLHSAVLVAATAPQMSAQGTFVYVIKDSIAQMRPITLGQRQGELIVVSTGLKPGEQVITTGQLGVTPGGKVHIQEATAQPNASASSKGSKS